MLITDDFIFVHVPKTGGSFVNRVVKKLYLPHNLYERVKNKLGLQPKCMYYTSDEPYENLNGYNYGQHCGLRHINYDKKYHSKTVFHIRRDPESYYRSLFFFAWYRKEPHLDDKILSSSFRDFPNLDTEEIFTYYQLLTENLVGKSELPYGHLTYELVDQLSTSVEERDKVLSLIEMNQIDDAVNLLKNAVPGMIILDMDDLVSELIRFLKEHTGFPHRMVDAIRYEKHVNVSKKVAEIEIHLTDHQKYLERFVYSYWNYSL